jgi:hypothetical protein
MRKYYITLLLLAISLFSCRAQYISKVLEYKPAPGQFVNTSPWGVPKAAETLVGTTKGTMHLGNFGGYVIFTFDEPVVNDPDNPYGVDLTIFGNPAAGWAEPGIVSVMKDSNKNGIPDETWYELAGSDHHFASTLHNYRVTYTNPKDSEAADVPWEDNKGDTGVIKTNPYHNQPYYPIKDSFPDISADSYTLSGTKIKAAIDTTKLPVKSHKKAFGYADNQLRGSAPDRLPDNPYTRKVENSGGDAFDIHWAIDNEGNYVDLDTIHFVKVHCGVLVDAEGVGELSTEITGAVDVPPDSTVNGVQKMVVIQDIPKIIDTLAYALEVFAFNKGRPIKDAAINWTTSTPEATVNENNVVSVSDSSLEVTLIASLNGDRSIADTVSTTFNIPADTTQNDTTDNDTSTTIYEKHGNITELQCRVYPNPATNHLRIQGINNCRIRIYSTLGRLVFEKENCLENERINLENLADGLHFVKIVKGNQKIVRRFIKQ